MKKTAQTGEDAGKSRRAWIMLGLLALGSAGPAVAAGPRVVHEAPGEVTSRIAVQRVDESGPAARRQMMRRIENAALEVCGGSFFSVPQAKDAIRRSTCWRESMADAVAQLDAPRFASTAGKQRTE